ASINTSLCFLVTKSKCGAARKHRLPANSDADVGAPEIETWQNRSGRRGRCRRRVGGIGVAFVERAEVPNVSAYAPIAHERHHPGADVAAEARVVCAQGIVHRVITRGVQRVGAQRDAAESAGDEWLELVITPEWNRSNRVHHVAVHLR